MREPNWVVLLIFAAVVFLGGIFFGSIGKKDLRHEADAWRRAAAENDSLIHVADGRWRRATVELEGAREARVIAEQINVDLERELRKSRAQIRNLQELVVTVPPDTVIVTATDTIFVDSGVTRVDFILPFEAATVTGYTLTPPPQAFGELKLDPLPISIVTSELPDGSWQTDVTLPPPYELGQLSTFTNPRQPSWWECHDFKVGIGLGVVGMILILTAGG